MLIVKVMLTSLVKKILGFINRHSGQNVGSVSNVGAIYFIN
ncbi:hypothetical protein COO91_07846 [Nostoc flagelliforme CCNUN1]|uniref:Uncharacterized protein n=1 Tax=Nostoc flagelliforme CCNUN1 TaxID=2038116 RepID=A0A2K8T443_9NOSO|nr:hypothetical protein COO91_07846 [Nostoc flagelliforme CCNUN1]